MTAKRLVLLTGATGYVGGRLLRALVEERWRVRCVARRPAELRARVPPEVEVVGGDVRDGDAMRRALAGVDAAYYLVHSLGAAGDFEVEDRRAAREFGAAAAAAGVRRIVYLGGLGTHGADLSPHLRSRQEVGEILRASGVQVVELRASIIIGSGSLSFEMVRALTERLPVMIAPRWVSIPAQPIAITDVVRYLVAALDLELDGSAAFEIGGADQVSYGGLIREYARQRGLRRLIVPVPTLTPRLSSLWLGLVTPVFARVGRKLIDSIRHATVVRDDAAARAFAIRPKGVREAIAEALRNEDRELAETRWSDALSSGPAAPTWGGVRFGSRLVDSRIAPTRAVPPLAFAVVERIGGTTGWYYGRQLWRLRGWLDLLVGGVGMRRGRRNPDKLAVGDALDCWRVEHVDPPRCLRLAAEMRLPGRAWLAFEVEPDGAASCIRQTASFDPVGLAGLAYWYAIYPLHRLVFAGMLRGIVAASDAAAAAAARDAAGPVGG